MHIQDSLAPNVIAMIRSFNQLALLVPSEILEETTPQARAKVITSYIQVYKTIIIIIIISKTLLIEEEYNQLSLQYKIIFIE